MELILWRHAEAEDIASNDLARRLTPRGERQAARMADWLGSRLGDSAQRSSQWHVIASPAVRAQQTAAALGLLIETIPLLAPDALAESVLRAAGWPTNSKNVIVVGHQPTLGLVAGKLINGGSGYVSVRKGAIWWFRQKGNDGESKAELVAMVSPEKIGDES